MNKGTANHRGLSIVSEGTAAAYFPPQRKHAFITCIDTTESNQHSHARPRSLVARLPPALSSARGYRSPFPVDRWYEAVILRTGNALAYKQVVVSGEDLYVTETPPRSLSHLLHAAQISDVSLVHDLPEFLRGGVRDQTTHVIVRFRSSRRASLAKAKVRRSTVEEPSTSSIDEEGDEEESDETDAPATHVLARAAHDTASVCSDPVPSLSLPTVDGGHANNRSYPR
ncbi:hypothetical protein C7M84_000473 [Penaeus vannamei]|uniref:Uncharacterized protein n=1 Tax=Penaeus vannamei TaxID=6689 RepID=A0A3R7MMG1_PENVA|nr:hypothetical protein C7M84_000473 [Penaeus vannamei]